MLVLASEERSDDPYRTPTRKNLLLAMRWLVEDCDAGDSLVFHFSGHGVQKLDTVGDEVDGYNEALCPLDFEEEGKILDDEINDTIVRPLGPGVKLHAIIDTCHSGTILDLPYLCRLSRYVLYIISRAAQRAEIENTDEPLLPSSKNRVLAVGEPHPQAPEAERYERWPRHLDQRLQRRPEVCRFQCTFARLPVNNNLCFALL